MQGGVVATIVSISLKWYKLISSLVYRNHTQLPLAISRVYLISVAFEACIHYAKTYTIISRTTSKYTTWWDQLISWSMSPSYPTAGLRFMP